MNFKTYEVIVIDHITKQEVTVGMLLTRSEVQRIVKTLEEFQACDIRVDECNLIYKRKGVTV